MSEQIEFNPAVRSTAVAHDTWALLPALGRQFGRLRCQLLGALLLALLLPVSLRWGIDRDAWLAPAQINTCVASALAIAAGLFAVRQIATFPGVRSNYYVVPILMVSFLVVLAGLLFFRVEHNRYLFPISFGLTAVWVFVCHSVARRYVSLRLATIPGGDVSALGSRSRAVTWIALSEPQLPPGGVDGIVVDLRQSRSPQWERFIADCALAGVKVFHSGQIEESLTGRVEIEHLSENTLGSINPDPTYLRAKQYLDWVVALIVLVVTAPLLLLIGLAVRLESPGPALFRQERMGYRGKAFKVFKFRTMYEGVEAAANPRRAAMTEENDPRVTPFGSFLRRTRIDELPQLLNVLKGEMSWIGPRPEAMPLSLWYQSEIPLYRYRHVVRPGISGWAQVNQGHVSAVEQIPEKLHYDFYYIKNFSPWLDILIVLRTIRTVITGFGAR